MLTVRVFYLPSNLGALGVFGLVGGYRLGAVFRVLEALGSRDFRRTVGTSATTTAAATTSTTTTTAAATAATRRRCWGVIVGHRHGHAGNRDALVAGIGARRAVGQGDDIVRRVRIVGGRHRHRLGRCPVLRT